MILKEADQLGMIISSFLSLGEHSKMCRKVFEQTTKHTERKTLGRNGLRERNTQVIAAVEDAVKKEEGRKLLEGMD
jgi:hypothetical protein